MTKGRFSLALLIPLLTGCAGAPTRYYTLPPYTRHAHKEATPFTAVALAPISMPPGYNRLALMTASGRARVHVAGHARWTAPLKSLLRAALIVDLAAQLAPPTIMSPPGAPLPTGKTAVIVLNVQKFIPDRTGRIDLTASWSLRPGGGGAVLSRGSAMLGLPGGQTPSQDALAMSKAAAELAHKLASQLARLGDRHLSRGAKPRADKL